MDFGITGRVAIVSGGSKGQGLATAHALLGEGCSVMIAARGRDALDSARDALAADHGADRIDALSADMTDAQAVASVVDRTRERFGSVDIVVSNIIGHVIDPGTDGPRAGHFKDLDAADYGLEFRQLLLSSWYLAMAAIPAMKARRWGRIFNIASGSAREPQWEIPHMLPNTVRPAVAALHRGLAAELSPHGITVNSMLTGPIATERSLAYYHWLAGERGVPVEDVIAQSSARLPLRRPGKPEDMGKAIAFLCSEQAGMISGQAIAVVGGRLRHLF
jgi:3-oxoacyl-[acyl-carrier protein] reductase